MLDLIYLTLLSILAALLGWAAREITRSIRRRQRGRAPFPYELLLTRDGAIRGEDGHVFVRINFGKFDDRDKGCARVVVGAAPRRGRRVGTHLLVFRSTINLKGGKRLKEN